MPVVSLTYALDSLKKTLQYCKEKNYGNDNPYFIIAGAGISAGTIDTAKQIVEELKNEYSKIYGVSYSYSVPYNEQYSDLLAKVFPTPIQRRDYFISKIQDAKINEPNLLLADILSSSELSQSGNKILPFANTVFTTNFDDLLHKSLDFLCKKFISVDSPNEIFKLYSPPKKYSRIIHVHGTYHYYDSCNLQFEIEKRKQFNDMLSIYAYLTAKLTSKSPIIIGYNGWNDVVIKALYDRLRFPVPYHYYWFCYSDDDLTFIERHRPIVDNENVYIVFSDSFFEHSRDSIDKELSLETFKLISEEYREKQGGSDVKMPFLEADEVLKKLSKLIYHDEERDAISNQQRTSSLIGYASTNISIEFGDSIKKILEREPMHNIDASEDEEKIVITQEKIEKNEFIDDFNNFFLRGNYDKCLKLIDTKKDEIIFDSSFFVDNILKILDDKNYLKIGTEKKHLFNCFEYLSKNIKSDNWLLYLTITYKLLTLLQKEYKDFEFIYNWYSSAKNNFKQIDNEDVVTLKSDIDYFNALRVYDVLKDGKPNVTEATKLHNDNISAYKAFKKYLGVKENIARAYYALGYIYDMKGMYQKANEEYRKIVDELNEDERGSLKINTANARYFIQNNRYRIAMGMEFMDKKSDVLNECNKIIEDYSNDSRPEFQRLIKKVFYLIHLINENF